MRWPCRLVSTFLSRARAVAFSEGLALAILTLLCVSVVIQAGWSRNATSVTFDEPNYLRFSINTFNQGELDGAFFKLGSAPLPMMVNTLPALMWDALKGRNRPAAWDAMVFDGRLIALPRLLTTLTSLVPLVALAFFWLKARRGLFAATFGAGLLAFSPSLLAHASLATHDATFAFHATLAAVAISWYFRAPSGWRLRVSAVLTSLAVSSKYTGVVLVPFFLLVLTIRTVADLAGSQLDDRAIRWLRLKNGVTTGIRFVVLTFVVTWALHGFQVTGNGRLVTFREPSTNNVCMRTFGSGLIGQGLARLSSATVEEPGFVSAIRAQIRHNGRGHCAFLMGMRSSVGWWYYFPIAVLLKSTLPELIVVFSAVVCLVARGVRRASISDPSTDGQSALLLLFAGILAAVLMGSRINIGHRYAIAIYPLAVLAFTDLLGERLARRRMLFRTAGVILLGAQVVTSLTTAPHYLSYFNRHAGGPKHGWQYLVDSNIDWGQDLPALKRVIEREGYRRVACDYFGTASLDGYGVSAETIRSLSRPISDYDAFAVSVTNLQMVYPRSEKVPRELVESYRTLRGLRPTHRAGHSIFVYDLRSPVVRAAFVAPAYAIATRSGQPRTTLQTASGDNAVRR
jgi:hypothetical protein